MFVAAMSFIVSYSQTGSLNGTNAILDTVVNTGTYYLTTPVTPTGNSGKFSLAYLATNKTLTTTITVVLQGSLDGTNWENLFKTAGTNGVNCDTLSVSGTTYHVWTVTPAPNLNNAGKRLYYRLKQVGGATGTTQVGAKITYFN